MFDIRLKRAQVALNDGRLDEACELLNDAGLKEHRTGQKIVTRLAKAYIKRSREHLGAKRLAAAMDDCNRAEKLAGNLPEIAELRSNLCREIEASRTISQQRAEQLAKAKDQLQHGWLSTGRKMLKQTDDDLQAQALLKNADILETETSAALKRIEQALKTDQIELAAQMYDQSSLKSSLEPQAAALLGRIQDQIYKKVLDYISEGQVHLADTLLTRLNGRVGHCDKIAPIKQAIAFFKKAVGQLESGCYADAALNLKKSQNLVPKAKWLSEAIDHLQTIAAAQTTLQAGPLGLLTVEVGNPVRIPETGKINRESISLPKYNDKVNRMDIKSENTSFMLQIDGIGAYYVFTKTGVTLGPISGSVHSDIEVIAAPDLQIKQIERVEGDYFLSDVSRGPQVKAAGKHLLNEGDRVELSERCRFKFTKPNPASSTACLVPSSAKFPRADINGVILMDREILIGPARNCHIQSGLTSETITLFVQDGQLRCRTREPMFVNGQPYLPQYGGVPMNQTFETGSLRMRLTPQKH